MTNPWAGWIRAHDTDRGSLSSKGDWLAVARSVPRPLPPAPEAVAGLSPVEREDYDEARIIWNANPATIKTPQLSRAFAVTDQVMASNYRDAGSLRGSVVLDAEPALGKTTIALRYARTFHARTIRRYGDRTRAGHQRVPVAYVSLSAGTTLKGLNQKLLRFYDHPAVERRSRASHFTLSTLSVETVVTGDIAPDSQVVVRQIGSKDQPPPAPLMEVDNTYLLYLTPSGLQGDLASQYYVTGGNAGLYVAEQTNSHSAASVPTFVQVDAAEGEGLPSTITIDEAAA